MNQSELARRAGLGRDAVSNYINGHNLPASVSLNKLCEALGLTKEELLPNASITALDNEVPAFELKVAANDPNKAWVRINRAMSFDTATKIVGLLNDHNNE